MNIKNNIKKIIESPQILGIYLLKKTTFLWSDKMYLKIMYRLRMGYWMDFSNPKTFNEKLQWMKLYDRNPVYTSMVDKYKVKNIVAEQIGEQYIIPTLGVWDTVDEIEYNSLPDKFILKTTHGGGGGGVVICRDKSKFNIEEANSILKKSMKIDIYKILKEWPYKNVRKRIIAEKLLIDNKHPESIISDYKFYCFSGKVEYILVANGRFSKSKTFDYFDRNFQRLPFSQGGKTSNIKIEKPTNLSDMISISEKLSKDIPHVRIDLYNVNDMIYFGEMTFFDSSGYEKFQPLEWDRYWGDKIVLPLNK